MTTTVQLSCGRTEVGIAPHRGAIVTSFRSEGRELLYLDTATFNDASKNVRGGIPILFPTPGKLEDDRWSFAGKSGELKQHGFARNLAWRVRQQDTASLTLELQSNKDTLENYPWPFAATLRYSLDARALLIEFNLLNTGSTPMPFALGYHPYFLVHDKSRATIDTKATQAFDNVTKRTGTFNGFDLTQSEVDIHLLDHNRSGSVLHLGDGRAIRIDCSAQFTRWVVWTLAGKDFVCVEPWTAPGNALNSGTGLTLLPPNETFESHVRLSC